MTLAKKEPQFELQHNIFFSLRTFVRGISSFMQFQAADLGVPVRVSPDQSQIGSALWSDPPSTLVQHLLHWHWVVKHVCGTTE